MKKYKSSNLINEFTRMDEEIKKLSRTVQYSIYIFAFFFLIIICRLWYLQIYKGPDLRRYSENNRLKKQDIEAPRGLIFSRDKKIIARNLLESELTLTPQYSKNIHEVAEAISPVIQIPISEIVKKIQKSKKENGLFFPFQLKKQLDLKQIYRLKLLKTSFPELNIREYIIRSYPLSFFSSQLIGYMGEISKTQIDPFNNEFIGKFHFKQGDQIGKNGIEETWEEELRGINGVSYIEVNAHSQSMITSSKELWDLPSTQPISGHHLVLTLDQDIQEAAFKAMNRKDKIGPRKGAVVVMKSNGEILAWVSSPSFDSNLFSKTLSNKYWKELAQNPEKPMLNKVIQNHYSPASTIKPFIALAALQENIIDENTLIDSPSKIRLGNRFFHDHNRVNYGKINLIQAIEQSSNTFFYQIGQKLGIDQMAFYMSSFGFGKRTEIKINGEIMGFVPTKQWKKNTFNETWQDGEDLVHSIGQGYILATPLQMAVAYNTIATKGQIVRPFLVQSIINSKNEVVKNFSSTVIEDLSLYIQEEYFNTIKEALTQVVYGSKGTARWWKMKEYPMAGKTGTVQLLSFDQKNLYQDCLKRSMNQRHHGWFVAFAPIDNPEITVSVLTENSCSGSSGSVPIARDIVRAYFKKYHKTEYRKQTVDPPAKENEIQKTIGQLNE